MRQYPKIAIIYLLFYHNESYVEDTVSALKKLTYPKDKVEFVIVSNPHPEQGSFVPYIEENVLPLSGIEIPHVTILAQSENLGFAGGNNKGAAWALEHGFDYVFFHNNDGFLAANALEPLVHAFESDTKIGMAQSLMLLHPDTERINSMGNSFHYLGFGFCNGYRSALADVELPPIKEIDYASGAALMIRADLIKRFGAWDEDFFLYHEDLEWSFRIRSAGYRIALARDSIFYHKYQFGRSIEKFFWMERNRHAVMLMFFRWPTLILLAPIALLLELGLWLFSVKNGYAGKRFQVYRYWFNPKHLSLWLKKRRSIQSTRTVSDRELLRHSVPVILFQEKEMENPILNYIGNPIMKAYYYLVVKGCIWW